MMNKIVVGILTFLLWLMPWFTPFHTWREKRTFDSNVIWSAVEESIETRNTARLQAMMRPWIKSNVAQLPEKLDEIFVTMGDEITGIEQEPGEYPYYYEGVYSVGKIFAVTTPGQVYYIRIVYEYASVHTKTDLGIARLQFLKGNTILKDIKTPQYS